MAGTTDGPGGAPRTERGARTRERIVTAAREVFEETGFPDTRISHITRRARVAYGSFYSYFPSKEAVFFEVADRLFDDMTRRGPLPGVGPSPAARIRRANRAYYESYRRNAQMMAVVEQVASINAEFRERRRKHRAQAIGRSGAAITRWQQAGLVGPEIDPEMAARALAAMVDHTLYLWLVQGEDADEADRLLDTLDALTIRALGLRPDA